MSVRIIAGRVVLELLRDRRTVVFLLAVPVLVMTMIYYALARDEVSRLGVVARGASRLFEGDLVAALEREDDIAIIPVGIADSEIDPDAIKRAIWKAVETESVHGVLYLDDQLLPQRFEGESGAIHLFVEGSRPTQTAALKSAVAGAMDDLAAALPVVIDANCSANCVDSVNPHPIDLDEHYLHGHEDYRLIDFFLPVLPPFFVFFFTFILATVTFQRERVRGTLERLLVAPVSFVEVVMGYILGFLGMAMVQGAIIVAFFVSLIGFEVSALQIAALAVPLVMTVLVALAMGLLASLVAHNEFQALQFIPLVILPQLFLGDIIWSISSFPPVFRLVSHLLPLTYANAVTRNLLIKQQSLASCLPQLAALAGFMVAAIAILLVVARKPSRVL